MRLVGGALALIAVATAPLAAAMAKPETPSLAAETRLLGARHCATRGARELLPQGKTFALVCSPHALVGGHPESEVWRCERSERRSWSCADPQRASLRRIGQRSVLLSRGTAISTPTALDVLRFVAVTYDHTFNGRDLSLMVGRHCTVASAGQPFPGAESYELTCGPERLTVTRDCYQGRCRLFPAALGLPTP